MSRIAAALGVLLSLGAVFTHALASEEDTLSCDSGLSAGTSADISTRKSCLIQRDLGRRDSMAEVRSHEPVQKEGTGKKELTGNSAPDLLSGHHYTDGLHLESKQHEQGSSTKLATVAEAKKDEGAGDSKTSEKKSVDKKDTELHATTQKEEKELDALPVELRQLGLQLFGTEENLKKVVSDSTEMKATVFDIPVKLRIKKGDNAIGRLPDEGKTDEYGINKIMDEGPSVHGMVNVVDMGANYGVVPIALFHKYPKHVRAVIAELVPTTYFFLRWNLLLNKVPLLTEKELEMKGDDRTPGVLALNKGVSGKDEADMHVCWSPDNSMNAMICDCNKPPFPSECLTVQTISTPTMLKFFGKDGVDFLKMDCEGCELHSLPALEKMDDAPKLIRRLVGELHEVPPEIEDIACKFNHKTWMTKVCRNRGAGQQLECNPETRDKKCYVPVPWPRP